MKVNEFMKLINNSLKVELSEDVLTKLDIELPEGFETKFTETYLTRDRAKSDDEVISDITKKSNKKAYDSMDEQIKELLPFVSDEQRQKINSVFSTAEKIKLLKPAIDEAMKSSKGKVTPEDVRKVEEEWSAKYNALQDLSKSEREQLLRNAEEKNFEFYVTQKLAGYEVATAFKPMREQINQMALLDLKGKGFKFEFENGTIAVRQEKDGVVRDVFDGDQKITLEKLLDKFVDPFIPKSNGGNTTTSQDASRPINIQVTGRETLAELSRIKAAQAI